MEHCCAKCAGAEDFSEDESAVPNALLDTLVGKFVFMRQALGDLAMWDFTPPTPPPELELSLD